MLVSCARGVIRKVDTHPSEGVCLERLLVVISVDSELEDPMAGMKHFGPRGTTLEEHLRALAAAFQKQLEGRVEKVRARVLSPNEGLGDPSVLEDLQATRANGLVHLTFRGTKPGFSGLPSVEWKYRVSVYKFIDQQLIEVWKTRVQDRESAVHSHLPKARARAAVSAIKGGLNKYQLLPPCGEE